MSNARDDPTRLLAEFATHSGSTESERARDIMLRRGAARVDAHQSENAHVVDAVFDNVCDATSAVIQIVDEAARLRQVSEDPLSGIRIALCTPPAGQPATELAGLLLARVEPGQILANGVSALVAGPMLPDGIHLLDRGVWVPDPGSEPERVYELRVTCERTGLDQPSNLEWARRAVGDHQTPSARLTELAESWQLALTAKRRMVLLTTGPGQDRTGVAAELALRAHTQGALVLYGRWDSRDGTPYQAIREAFGVYASTCSTERLRSDLEGWAGEISALLPEVGARAGGVRHSASYVDRARMFEAAEAWITSIAGRTPTLLVLDDVQWAEQSSLDLLARLWQAVRGYQVMILVTGEESAEAEVTLARMLEFGAHTEAGAFERLSLRPGR
jgi:hypothetical protein